MFWIYVWAFFCHILASESQECGGGWEEFNNKCFYLSANFESRSWHKAYEYCRARGAHLTSVHLRDEMDFIVHMAEESGNKADVWLGGNDLDDRDGNYKWTDGSVFHWTDWAPSQPNPDHLCIFSKTTIISDCFTREEGISRIEGVIDNPNMPPPGCKRFGYWNPDNVDRCEEQCARDISCNVYTYISNTHPIPAWQGECLGCDFATTGPKVVHQYATSGEQYNCGEGPSKLWHSANCGSHKNFVCRKDKGSDTPLEPTPTAPIPGYCPEGFLNAGRKCFKVVNLGYPNGISWGEARDNCQQEAGHLPDLASVSNKEETAVLMAAMQDYSWGVWIGLTQKGSDWLWVDNSDTEFHNWNPQRPGWHSCVEFVTIPPGTWSDLACNDKRGYVCEVYKDANNPLPQPPTTPHQCRPGYIPYWYACYRVSTTPTTWDAAESNCVQDMGHLVSIHTVAENSAIWYFIQSSGIEFPIWLGLQQNQNNEFTWSDGWWNRYANWNADNPGNVEQMCTVMDANDKWNATGCTQSYRFICKTTTVSPLTTPSYEPGTCPEGWIEYGHRCFYINNDNKKNWDNANTHCQDIAPEYQSNLVSIHDHVTNEFLTTKIADSSWIGLRKDGADEPYVWKDGSHANFTRWAPGEPSEENGTENCVEMYADTSYFPGTWNDHICSDVRGYICETLKLLPITTPTLPAEIEGDCPSDEWDHYGQWCFLFKPDLYVTWEEGQSSCHTSGSHLASIHDSAENLFVWNSLLHASNLPTRRGAWIGMYKTLPGDDYIWDGGADVVYHNWAPGQPSGYDGIENCVETFTLNGEWQDNVCTERLGYVCRIHKASQTGNPTSHTTIPTTLTSSTTSNQPPTDDDCPSEAWEIHGHNCYLFKPGESVTWKEAQCACTEYMSHVVSINDCDENAFVWNRLVINSELATESRTWIGLYKTEAAVHYTWWDGSDMLYNNWAIGHPSMGNEKCAVIDSKDGEWMDLGCELKYGYVCKINV